MDKCVKRIYSPRHDSLLPVWNAAVEIRRELLQFAEQQLKDMKFGLVGDPSTGELGVCQAMVSTSKYLYLSIVNFITDLRQCIITLYS